LLKVKDVMNRKVITVKNDLKVREAVNQMNNHGIGCLVVLERESVVGMLTERDVLKRVVGEGRDPEKTTVGKVMSKPLVAIDPEASLEETINLMFKEKIKKIPVVKDKKLLGLVTMTDIARVHPKIIEYVKTLITKYEVPTRMEKVIKYYIV
jgi:CBS domain-containing protein